MSDPSPEVPPEDDYPIEPPIDDGGVLDPEPEPEPIQYVNSALVKSAMLVHDSRTFQRLVEAAAWKARIPYTEDVLRFAATRDFIIDAINLPVGEGMDYAIDRLLAEMGPDVDEALIAAVQQYQPPQQ